MRQNLFPVQIEDAITRHSGILDAAAVSVPDERYGEVVGVWIVRREGQKSKLITRQEVRKYVSEAMNPQVRQAFVSLSRRYSFLLFGDPTERAGVGVVHGRGRTAWRISKNR